MSGEADFAPLTPESVRDESDPLVCEAQVAARQIVEAAQEGMNIEALQEAMEADPDHPGHLVREAFASTEAKVAASIDRDEYGLIRAGEGDLEALLKDRDPGFDARSEVLRKRMIERVCVQNHTKSNSCPGDSRGVLVVKKAV